MTQIVLLGESTLGTPNFNIPEKNITDMELTSLCMESVNAGADLAMATNVTANVINTQIRTKAGGDLKVYAESNVGKTEIVEIYSEAVFGSGGMISKLVDKIVAVFRMLVNLVSGFFQKFSSNAKNYRATLSTIQAIGRDVESYNFPDSAKFDVVPHVYGDAMIVAPTLLDTDKYMKLKLGTGADKSAFDDVFKDMKSISKLFDGNTSTDTEGQDDGGIKASGTKTIDGLTGKINSINSAIGTEANAKTYDKFIAYLINSLDGLKEVSFKTPINLDKSVREKLIADIFKSPNDKKKVTPKEAYEIIKTIGSTESTDTIDAMLRTLQDGAKKFKEIGDDFKEVGTRLKSAADRYKDKNDEKADADLKAKAPVVTSALTSFSGMVATLNGTLNQGYTIGAGLLDQTFREAGKVAKDIESAMKKHGSKK